MNKRGFTLIELLVSFTLITIVSLSLFKTVLAVQKKAQKDIAYNQYLSFASTFSNSIQKDFTGDKILSFSSCGDNCYDIVYETAGTKEIKIDRTNNTVSYGTVKEKLPINYIFYDDLDLTLNQMTGIAADNYNSIFTLSIPIKNNLSESYSDITYTYQYDNRVDGDLSSAFKSLTINPNGGIYAGSTSNTQYNLLKDNTQELSIPMKQNYIFNGWTRTCTTCLSGNTYTMGTTNDTLTAQWLLVSSSYTYTGSSTVESDASGNWKIKFLTSGTFTPLINMTIDAFLVGGGAAGGYSTAAVWGGMAGGGGGYTKTISNISVTNTAYSITVAPDSANNGNSTIAFGTTVAGGIKPFYISNTPDIYIGGAGGSGGGTGGGGGAGGAGGSNGSNGFPSTYESQSPGVGQGTTTREFGETTGSLYAGGGGGGSYNTETVALGGAGGGGNGATTSLYCTNGTTNTGGGGGGTRGQINQTSCSGGSGIVIIRNHR